MEGCTRSTERVEGGWLGGGGGKQRRKILGREGRGGNREEKGAGGGGTDECLTAVSWWLEWSSRDRVSGGGSLTSTHPLWQSTTVAGAGAYPRRGDGGPGGFPATHARGVALHVHRAARREARARAHTRAPLQANGGKRRGATPGAAVQIRSPPLPPPKRAPRDADARPADDQIVRRGAIRKAPSGRVAGWVADDDKSIASARADR